MAIQCDCFCSDKSIHKFYPYAIYIFFRFFLFCIFRKSCTECTIELCKKNNTRGFAGWCIFGTRTIHCSEYNPIPLYSVA